MSNNTVSQNVRLVRRALRVSPQTMADLLEMSLSGYHHIERGNSRLDCERLRVIAAHFKVDVGIFFDEEKTKMLVMRIWEQRNQQRKKRSKTSLIQAV